MHPQSCKGRRTYLCEAAARKVARYSNKLMQQEPDQGQYALYAYRCPDCHAWHVGPVARRQLQAMEQAGPLPLCIHCRCAIPAAKIVRARQWNNAVPRYCSESCRYTAHLDRRRNALLSLTLADLLLWFGPALIHRLGN